MPNWVASQFSDLSRFVAVNSETKEAVQGCLYKSEADRICVEFNEHEARCGRTAIYDVRPIPAKLHNHDPRNWQKLLDEGEEVRQTRIVEIARLQRTNYPSTFVVLASQALKASGSDPVNWSDLHEVILAKSIGVDVRDPPRALSELLNYSPGVVTHEEQDILCKRMEDLVDQHYVRRATERGLSAPTPQAERQRG